jgi:hypothetical protein
VRGKHFSFYSAILSGLVTTEPHAYLQIEGWSFIVSCYWACVTLLTVGFGDVVPTTNLGRGFTICYCLFGCAYMAKSFQDFANVPVVMRLKKNENKVINQFTRDLSRQKLELIFNNEFFNRVPRLKRWNSEISKSEFVLMVLTLMNKIEEKDILIVAEAFEKLDNGKGFLSNEEMQEKVANAIDESPEADADEEDVLETLSNITATVSNTVNNVTSTVNETLSRVSVAFRDGEAPWLRPSMAGGPDSRFSIFNRKSQAGFPIQGSQSSPGKEVAAAHSAAAAASSAPRRVRSRNNQPQEGSSPVPSSPPTSAKTPINSAPSSSATITNSTTPPAQQRRGSAFGLVSLRRNQNSNPNKATSSPEAEIELAAAGGGMNASDGDDTAWTINPINAKRTEADSLSTSLPIENHAPAFGRPISVSPKPGHRTSVQRLFGSNSPDTMLRSSETDDRSRSPNSGKNSGRLSPLRMPAQRKGSVLIQNAKAEQHASPRLLGVEAKNELERPSESDEIV